MKLRTVLLRSAAAVAVLGLAACAGAPPAPVADDAEGADTLPAAFAVAGSVPPAQLPATLTAFDARLKAALADAAGRPSGIWRLQPERAHASRVILDADRAFEAGNAQLRPELLLPLSGIAEASRDGAWVIHVIGHADRAEDRSLAERRAASVASYLGRQGLSGGRLRAEARSEPDGGGHRLELVFSAIVEGRELRAWMPPTGLATKR